MIIKNIEYGKKEFVLQWHITNRCDMNCPHCYVPLISKNDEDKLSTEKCKYIIDNFCDLLNKLQIPGRINFTGGNPLLREDFFEIAQYASKKGIRIGILGNPTSLLDERIIKKLNQINIFRYQISIDGLKENHEKIRGDGSFEIAMKGLETLVKYNIPAVVLTTVTKENMNDIPKLAEICLRKGVIRYDFARLVPIGEGKQFFSLMPSKEEYRAFLYEMYKTYLKLKRKYKMNVLPFGTKDPLWTLLYSELGLLKPSKEDKLIYGGCSIGINHLCIDSDGTVYSCRRLEIPIGNSLEDSLYNLFIHSTELNRQREFNRIAKCNSCELLRFCRGCRAVAWAVNKSYFSEDPQCWK